MSPGVPESSRLRCRQRVEESGQDHRQLYRLRESHGLEQGAMRRILVLGARGMAGHVMAEYLAQQEEYEIIPCARSGVTPDTVIPDVTDFGRVEEVLRDKRPD